MKSLRKPLVVAAAVLAFGLLRLGPEQRFTEDLREAGLHAPRLEIGTGERLGQTSWAVALGGLRTLIAALWNLRAFGYFEHKDWFRLEETYETIVSLAPRSTFYWDTGAWHIAYNSAVDYLEDVEQPPLRRRQKWAAAIGRGTTMLERGIRNNPDDWSLAARLARLHEDRNKIVNLPEAARWFEYSIERGAPGHVVRAHVYTIGRIPGRQEEALDKARRLHAEDQNRVPSLNCILFALEARHNPQEPVGIIAGRVFDSPLRAWQQLVVYARRDKEGFPQNGVHTALLELGRQLHANPARRTPQLNSVLFGLEARAGADPLDLARHIFDDPLQTWVQLSAELDESATSLPQDGYAAALLASGREIHPDPVLRGRLHGDKNHQGRIHPDPARRGERLNPLLFALEVRDGARPLDLIDSLFDDDDQAWQQLRDYWRGSRRGLPRDGVREALEVLEQRLRIPQEDSALRSAK